METQASAGRDVARYHRLFEEGRPGEHAYVVLLGIETFDLPSILRAIEKGLTWKTLQRFVRNSGLSLEQVADLVGIPRRTLQRRRMTGRLTSQESDRLLRAARIYSRALELFDGQRDDATHWLTGTNTAIGGVAPIELARTEIGANEVDHLIGRIEHGIFS
jgi:putative toxin-antitoxin system antitoxin component (TIGR02293 family)